MSVAARATRRTGAAADKRPLGPPAGPSRPSSLEALRGAFCRTVGPGVVTGLPVGLWLRTLADNGFRVAPEYWPRATAATLGSLLTSAHHPVERAMFGGQVAAQAVLPPLFVLGHWRSGTTHLHNLLAVDGRFASPRFTEVMIPFTFLVGEPVFSALARLFLPRTRFGIDNVSFHADVPFEEEFALAQLTGLSPYLAWAFPERAGHYDRYLSFRDASEVEVERWKKAFVHFLKKLTCKHRKPVILKSPPNTARVRLLLDIFPDARFVHIHRDPYTVYRSTVRLHERSTPNNAFQRLDRSTLHERVVRQYVETFDAFFADRSLIPPGRFSEVAFGDLEADPVGQVGRIYDELGLPDFGGVRSAVESYVGTLDGYRKNRHADLTADLRTELASKWRRSFNEWGYRT